MELRDLRFFCATAELQHVTKAADKLSVSQPFLTKIIGQIENEIGTPLFDKVGRHIKLNYCGEVFYDQAKKVLADMDNLFTEVDYALERQERSITLLCNTEAYLSRLSVEYQKSNPNCILQVKYASRQEMVTSLKSGDADFVLCSPPIDDNLYPELKTEVVLHDIGCVLLPPGCPLLEKESVTFHDLRDMPLITNLKGGAMRSKLDVLFEKHNFHPHIICESYNIDLIIRNVMNGLGYAFLTHLLVEDYNDLTPYCVEIDIENKVGLFGLTYNRLTENNRNSQNFRKFVVGFLMRLQKALDEKA